MTGMKRFFILGWVFVTVGICLSGCYESVDVELHEPGVYKGSYDPLLNRQRSAQLEKKLEDRFMMIQTDR